MSEQEPQVDRLTRFMPRFFKFIGASILLVGAGRIGIDIMNNQVGVEDIIIAPATVVTGGFALWAGSYLAQLTSRETDAGQQGSDPVE